MDPLVKFSRKFFEKDTLDVARELLGKYLVHRSQEGITIGKIVECEAYVGPDDPASHSYRGLKTKRTQVQFGPGGYAYIYSIYGKYCCFNVVTQKENMPEVVLIRALEPIEGIRLMQERRNLLDPYKKCLNNLMNGPSKLCIAMRIDKSLYGFDLCGEVLFIARSKKEKDVDIVSTPRINIDYAGSAKYYPWRYYIKNSECVSPAKIK